VKKIKLPMISFLFTLLLIIFSFSCNKEDNPLTPAETPLAGPVSIKAYSRSSTDVGLTWTKSVDATKSNFNNYSLVVYNTANNYMIGVPVNIAKTDTTYIVSNLTEGTVYKFLLTSVSTTSTAGGSDSVLWSPAKRIEEQSAGVPIKVYETASTQYPSGLDFQNSTGQAERVSVSASFPDQANRADLFVATAAIGNNLELRNPTTSTKIPIPRTTKFSTEIGYANSLDDPQKKFPAENTFTLDLQSVSIDPQSVGRIYYAKTQEGNYVRILLVRDPSDNSLVWGSSPDRYLTMKVSFQTKANVPYAKTAKHN
jgi:hypothetical protein